ncbi:ABC transporter extracellular solute binding protein [Kutzneria sp. 744]|nr:ABC transporter extracellular solute binding protein [Kutzneria sp. 744]
MSGGTFTFASAADPGNLDPQASASGTLFQFAYFAYDRLLSIDPKGEIRTQLAKSWQVDGKQVKLTMNKGVTCSDGSSFTAQTAADNINYIADPKNASPYTGLMLPVGARATADANTVNITLPQDAPFVLNGLAGVPMVCAKGLADRKVLVNSTDGTGPYQLAAATPNDQYTFTKRAGYTWGPDGATTAQPGLPDKVVVKVVPNESTVANLVLSGQINAAVVLGPDVKRLEAAKVFSADVPALIGQMWYNQAPGRPSADRAVRLALTQAVDLAQLRQVLTSGKGEPATALTVTAPVACPGNSVSKAVPTHDLAAAKAALDAAGWVPGSDGIRAKGGKPLALTFVYNTQSGPAASSAAELAVQQWGQLGVKVTLSGQDTTASTNTLYTTGNWDIAWEPVNVYTPDQLVGFFVGSNPPQGNNFAHIDNPAYAGAAAQAMKTAGAAGCPQWLSAESNLFRDADVVPFANEVAKYFGSGAKFSVTGVLLPLSIRMTAG